MPLEPADRVVRQALHLGQAARDRRGLLAQAVAERFADLHGAQLDHAPKLPSASDGRPRARLRPAAGADRAASGRRGATSRGCSSTRARPATVAAPRLPRAARARAAGALTVVNDTRVVPARIPIERPRGEVLLLEQVGRRRVGGARAPDAAAARRRALRPGRAARASRRGALARAARRRAGRAARRCRRTSPSRSPIPERYQTVYAREQGSAAAPTAGLHFTPELLARLDVERVTLHVGLDTFRPLQAERVEEHHIHGERYEVERGGVAADRAPRRRCSPSARRRCASLETRRARRPARRPHGALHHARASSSAASTTC